MISNFIKIINDINFEYMDPLLIMKIFSLIIGSSIILQLIRMLKNKHFAKTITYFSILLQFIGIYL
jgi:hypothetical protein